MVESIGTLYIGILGVEDCCGVIVEKDIPACELVAIFSIRTRGIGVEHGIGIGCYVYRSSPADKGIVELEWSTYYRHVGTVHQFIGCNFLASGNICDYRCPGCDNIIRNGLANLGDSNPLGEERYLAIYISRLVAAEHLECEVIHSLGKCDIEIDILLWFATAPWRVVVALITEVAVAKTCYCRLESLLCFCVVSNEV